jgi:hypothetical protein
MSEISFLTRSILEATKRAVRGSLTMVRVGIAVIFIGMCVGGFAFPRAASAQSASEAGSIHGKVVDAESMQPLEGVIVRLERTTEGVAERPLTFLTDVTGEYRFRGLASATYRLQVERLGYLRRSVLIDLNPGSTETLSIGLLVDAIMLPSVQVRGHQVQPYLSTKSPAARLADTRKAVTQLRQREFLVADARRLTHSDVVEAVTLGESDLFRALHRVPGVSTRDDYTATLWTRGASWDQTRVYFDGLPLFNPTHAGWLFSAVNPDAVGDVTFQPGHRSARWGEGSAAILDLRSRSGGLRPLAGAAEVSLASTRLALDGAFAGGDLRWMVAGRRTYVDLLTQMAESVTGAEVHVPYDFSDLVGRVDGRFGDGWGFEASTLLEQDHLRGDIDGLIMGNEAEWGNQVGQVTLIAPLPVHRLGIERLSGRWQARITYGETRFGTRLDAFETDSERQGALRTLPPLENAIHHRQLGITVEPYGSAPSWSLGYQRIDDAVEYDGPFSLFSVVSDEPGNSWTHVGRLRYQVVWGERRLTRGPLEVLAGTRVEMGDSVHNGGRVRIAPRLATRLEVDPVTSLSMGWARGFQYTQDVAPTAGPVGPQLHLSAIWVLAGPAETFPAIQTDVVTLGAERWLGKGWLGTVNLYQRWGSGIKVPNPESGPATPSRVPDAVAENEAHGVETSLRRMGDRWSASIGYALSRSRMESEVFNGADTVVFRFPSSEDLRQAVDATMMMRMGRGMRLGGAFSFGSGIPYTRVVLSEVGGPPPRLEEPNAERTPVYASLDLMGDYTRRMGRWEVNAYVQLRNSFNRDNAVTYAGSMDCGGFSAAAAPTSVDCAGFDGIRDTFEPGLPRLPLVGVRVTF